jgi:hypothetical protein
VRPSSASAVPVRRPYYCDKAEAQALTAKIKDSVDRTWRLLSNAFEWRAWEALGYRSWEAYVRDELGISRSRAYQLLDQAKVVREIQAAASVHNVDISEAVARDIKPHLAQVAEQVREAVADVPAPARPAVVADVVRNAREQVVADRGTGEVLSAQEWAAQNPSPDKEGLTPPGQAEPYPADADGWTPSRAAEAEPTSSPAPARPAAAAKALRPSSIEQDFSEAVRELARAVNRVERLSADGRFTSQAVKINDKHRPSIANVAESIDIVLVRMRAIAARTAGSPVPADLISGGDGATTPTAGDA